MTASKTWTPSRLAHFVGQEHIKDALADEVEVARRNNQRFPHMVGLGPPGLGKTQFLKVLAADLCRPIEIVLGRDLNPEVLTDILFGRFGGGDSRPPVLPKGYDSQGRIVDKSKVVYPFLVIDEADDLSGSLYHALHDVLVPADDGRVMFTAYRRREQCRIWIPHVTVVLLTNHMGKLAQRGAACLSRIPYKLQFEPYPANEIEQMVSMYALNRGIQIHPAAMKLIAERATGTPRLALSMLDRAHTRALAIGADEITEEIALDGCVAVGIDENGLTKPQVTYLSHLARSEGGRLGLESLAAKLGWDKGYVQKFIEPDLIRRGLVEVIPGGRQISTNGLALVEISTPSSGIFSRRI